MKFVMRVLSVALLFLLATVVYDMDIVSVYGSQLVGVVVSAGAWCIVSTIAALALALPVVGAPTILGALVAMKMGSDKVDFKIITGIGMLIGVVLLVPVDIGAEIWLLTNLWRWLDFFPRFTGWQAFAYVVVAMVVGVFYSVANSNKKKEE